MTVNQMRYLLCLGAYENRTMEMEKKGITSDMLAYPENERLWCEKGRPISWNDYVHREIAQLTPKVLDVAVDGTLFPAVEERFEDVLREAVYAACEEIELHICFDGFSFEEAKEISSNKELFRRKLLDGELEYRYVTHMGDERSCILTAEQVLRLATLSIEMEVYTYFGDVQI